MNRNPPKAEVTRSNPVARAIKIKDLRRASHALLRARRGLMRRLSCRAGATPVETNRRVYGFSYRGPIFSISRARGDITQKAARRAQRRRISPCADFL